VGRGSFGVVYRGRMKYYPHSVRAIKRRGYFERIRCADDPRPPANNQDLRDLRRQRKLLHRFRVTIPLTQLLLGRRTVPTIGQNRVFHRKRSPLNFYSNGQHLKILPHEQSRPPRSQALKLPHGLIQTPRYHAYRFRALLQMEKESQGGSRQERRQGVACGHSLLHVSLNLQGNL
jgi:hypothetical protein